jgi:hypothetical protein
MPDKWKGGRIEKFFNYWKGVRMDYAEAFKGKRKRTSLTLALGGTHNCFPGGGGQNIYITNKSKKIEIAHFELRTFSFPLQPL